MSGPISTQSAGQGSPISVVPLKVTKRTKELVRLGAAMERCTQGEFVKRAVDSFIEAHADELRDGLEHTKAVLGV